MRWASATHRWKALIEAVILSTGTSLPATGLDSHGPYSHGSSESDSPSTATASGQTGCVCADMCGAAAPSRNALGQGHGIYIVSWYIYSIMVVYIVAAPSRNAPGQGYMQYHFQYHKAVVSVPRHMPVARLSERLHASSALPCRRLYLGIADGMPIARVWAPRYSK